jgi:hypothetical protein
MKNSRYSESQIIKILKKGESGMLVNDICREHGICRATYFKWKSKYGGLTAHVSFIAPDRSCISFYTPCRIFFSSRGKEFAIFATSHFVKSSGSRRFSH